MASSPIAAAKETYSFAAASIRTRFFDTHDAGEALLARTDLIDNLVIEAWRTLLEPQLGSGCAVLAVGGYGRRQQFPFSDVDLMLLFDNEIVAHHSKELISAFLQHLWDVGLRVSHSVRTPQECCEVHDRNVELNVSLLDQRLVAGDSAVYGKLDQKLPRFVHGQRDALVRNLARLTHERYDKYGGTLFHLEPNVKETPGGLRDLQVLGWLSQLKETTGQKLGGAAAPAELEEARQFLFGVRCFLHYRANRDANALHFEEQDAIAAEWGGADPADWMRLYYRHARAIFRECTRRLETAEGQASSLLAQFRDWRTRLSNTEFSVSRERIHFRSPQRLETDPGFVLALFEFCGRHGVRPSVDAEQRIAEALPRIEAHFREPRKIWPELREILSSPHAGLALRAMHDSGVLQAIFPELRETDSLVVRDFYHRYTVDEHTLVAIQAILGLRGVAEGIAKPYADLLTELGDFSTLLFALLFHDAGKGTPETGHVAASLAVVEGPMERTGMPAGDRDMVRFLIARHLEMSDVMTTRDIFDPDTAREVAHRIETVERLKALTLLTWADISAVNPTAMTPWRSERLWHLYLETYNELTRELDADRIAGESSMPPARAAFLRGFPTRYLRTHSDAEIDAHMALEEMGRSRGVGVDLRKTGGGYALTIVANDRPFLFASVAGTLSSFGMNILKAEAFANERGLILDSFVFADPQRTLDLNPSELDRLRLMVERAVLGKTDVRQALASRPKPPRKYGIRPVVAFNNDASRHATQLQVTAEDRPGLLYDLAWAISTHGCNIEVVLIDTQAHKAIDVFYLTVNGQKLDADLGAKLEAAMLQAVG